MPVNINGEQISLFDLLFENSGTPAKEEVKPILKTKSTSTTAKTKTVKSEVPEILTRITQSSTLEEALRFLPIDGESDGKNDVYIKYRGYDYSGRGYYGDLRVVDNSVIRVQNVVYSRMWYSDTHLDKNTEITFLYFDENGQCWGTTMKMDWNEGFYYFGNQNIYHCEISFSKPAKVRKLVSLNDSRFSCNLIVNPGEVKNIQAKVNPYGYKFLKDCFGYPSVFDCAMLLLAPQLEQLCKAGYSIGEHIVKTGVNTEQKVIDAFNRLTQPGNNMKEIFKCSKTLYTAMRQIDDICSWDVYRKMEKQGKFSKDTIVQAIDAGFKKEELEWINKILNKKTYEGKPVFTWDTLQNYLGRLDNFQALKGVEAFQILVDYLSMCEQLEVNPRIDSDSLKREHDVAARTLREKYDEIMAKNMIGACDYLKVNDYEEDVYFIRGIRDYDDLVDEAKQQGNCVAGYARLIIAKKALIYVMRRKSDPSRSLITVEIDPEMSHIRQKLLAYNRDIYNRSQTEFLDRWIAKVRQRKKMGEPNIKSEVRHTGSILTTV